MLGLRLTTDAQPRSKNGRPAHRTTGAAHTSCSQFEAVRLRGSAPAPAIISVIAMPNTGRPIAAAIRKRRVMSTSSGLGASSGAAARGSSAMPHSGQAPGASCTTSGCMGQVYSTAAGAAATTSGSSAMPQLGQGIGSLSRTSGHIGQTYAAADEAEGSRAPAAGGRAAARWPCREPSSPPASSRAPRNASGSLRNAAWHPPQQNR